MGNKNIFFYFRLIFCISLIGIWTLWLSHVPEDKKNIHIKNQQLPNKKNIDLEAQDVMIINELPQKAKKITSTEHKALNLPKLEDLDFVNEPKKILSIKQKTNDAKVKSNPDKIKSPKEEPPANITKLALRKKVNVDKSQHSPILKKIINENNTRDTRTIESWLPTPSQETSNIQSNQNNNDTIHQIELVGLIYNPNGESAAILKNKTNNKIEILKTGDNIQELKVLEITTNQVLLLNEITQKMLSLKSH